MTMVVVVVVVVVMYVCLGLPTNLFYSVVNNHLCTIFSPIQFLSSTEYIISETAHALGMKCTGKHICSCERG
jgi:hypothetical protein